jgi:hypothetical protein
LTSGYFDGENSNEKILYGDYSCYCVLFDNVDSCGGAALLPKLGLRSRLLRDLRRSESWWFMLHAKHEELSGVF